jgi:hypothetical protein
MTSRPGGRTGGSPFQGGRPRKKTGNHAEAELSTRHFYFAENPTFLFCVDTLRGEGSRPPPPSQLRPSFPTATLLTYSPSDSAFGVQVRPKRPSREGTPWENCASA